MTRSADVDDEFERFVLDFTPTLLRGAYFLVGDRSLAEDAVQSTMLRTSRHWRRARAAPQAYSRQVLVNVCRENWRRQASRPVEVRSPDAALGHDGGSFTDQIDQRATLDHALSALSSTQREVLVLRFFFDLSVEQTAALLGIAAGTVKSATSRGLGQLRQILDPSDAKEFLC